MSRAMQKYADQRGINLAEAGEEGIGRSQRSQMQLLGDQAEQQTDDAETEREGQLTEDASGMGLGGGLALGKVGSMLRDAAGKGTKVLSNVDKAAARVSRIARATGNESVADGIDGARASARSGAATFSDTSKALEDASKGISNVSRDGLTSMVDNASNVSQDLIKLAPKSTDIASSIQSTVSSNSRQVMGNAEQTLSTADGPVQDTRGVFRKLFTKAPKQEDDVPDSLEELRQKQAGQTYTEDDLKNLASNDQLETLNPELAAPDRAVADAGRSIADVSKSFASQTADDLVAGGTDAGRIARGITPATEITADASNVTRSTRLLGGLSGDSTLARATATTSAAGGEENPFSFKSFIGGDDPTLTKSTTSKFGDVLQTSTEDAEPLEGTRITSSQGSVNFQPRAQPSAAPDNIDPNAPASGGQAPSSNLGRNGGLTEEEKLSKASSSQTDADLTNDLDVDTDKLAKLGGDGEPTLPGMSSGAADDVEEALSLSDKFMKYGGAALEGVGFLGDAFGIGVGIYDMTQGPSLKDIDKQKGKIEADEMAGSIAKPISYGSVSGATLNTMADSSAGTFQHF